MHPKSNKKIKFVCEMHAHLNRYKTAGHLLSLDGQE